MNIFGVGMMLACLALSSCDWLRDGTTVQEAVLSKGETVEAVNKNGRIRISYIAPAKRKYEWDDRQAILKLRVRTEPFQGRLGIYNSGDTWMWSTKPRLVLEEAIRRFDNEDQVRAALVESSDIMDWVYTNDGLVIGFAQTLARRQTNVVLWQFLLAGKKPTHLTGAQPDRIVRKAISESLPP